MKKSVKSDILFVIQWTLVWIVLPIVLFLGTDILLLRKPLNIAFPHSIGCSLGITATIMFLKALDLIWEGTKKFWYKILPEILELWHVMTTAFFEALRKDIK